MARKASEPRVSVTVVGTARPPSETARDAVRAVLLDMLMAEAERVGLAENGKLNYEDDDEASD